MPEPIFRQNAAVVALWTGRFHRTVPPGQRCAEWRQQVLPHPVPRYIAAHRTACVHKTSSPERAFPERFSTGQTAWCKPTDFLPTTPAGTACIPDQKSLPRGLSWLPPEQGGGEAPAERRRFPTPARPDRPAWPAAGPIPRRRRAFGAFQRRTICGHSLRCSSCNYLVRRRCPWPETGGRSHIPLRRSRSDSAPAAAGRYNAASALFSPQTVRAG